MSASNRPLNINQISHNNFFHTDPTIIHQTHPCHLVTGFQFLGRASGLHHLMEHPVHPLLGGIVNVKQVGGEFSSARQLPPQVFLSVYVRHL